MEVRGSNIQVQPGYPQQVWRNVDAAGASADVAVAHSEDKVLHYVVKVDRYNIGFNMIFLFAWIGKYASLSVYLYEIFVLFPCAF